MKVIGLDGQGKSGYNIGQTSGDSSYDAYLRMLDEVGTANRVGMTAREFAQSQGVPSTLTDAEAAGADASNYRMSEGKGDNGVVNESVGNVVFDSEKLLKAGNQLDKGGELTKAGRAIEKHGNRSGSIYPHATGNVASKNALGNQILKSILSNTNATSITRHHALYGDILEIKIPGGMGARFSADGSIFIGFLE